VTVVNDLLEDKRFARHQGVLENPKFRFYAGKLSLPLSDLSDLSVLCSLLYPRNDETNRSSVADP